jgi:lysophospholipase L1-like esterase
MSQTGLRSNSQRGLLRFSSLWRRFRWPAFLAYVVLLHLLLGVALLKSNFAFLVAKNIGLLDREEMTVGYYEDLIAQLKEDAALPEGAVVFLGDSMTHDLDIRPLASPAANFGIVGDTTLGLLNRLPLYRSLPRARAVVVAVGVNDLKYRSVPAILSAYRQLIDALPAGIPLVVSAVLPVDEQGVAARERAYLRNAAIRELDVGLHALCASRSACTYADATPLLVDPAGNLAAPLSRGDGWHLGPAGNQIWGATLARALGASSR